MKLRLGEDELAAVAFGGGHPEVYGLLPAAVTAALDDDYALLERLVYAYRAGFVGAFIGRSGETSIATAVATSCHDYPRPYDLARRPRNAHRQYSRALAALDPAAVPPVLAARVAEHRHRRRAGLPGLAGRSDRGLAAARPRDPRRAGARPVGGPGHQHAGRAGARRRRAVRARELRRGRQRRPHAGPQPCGVAMALDFIGHLTTDPDRCRHAAAAAP